MGEKMRTTKILAITLPIIIIALSIYILNQPRVFITNQLYPEFTLDELAQRADVIIIGKVKDIKEPIMVYNNNDKRLPVLVRDIVISIDRELTSNYNETEITIRTLGGKTDKLVSLEEGVQLEEGEEVLLFTNSDAKDPILKDRYYISGGEQGKFKIIDGKAYNIKYKDGIAVEELVNKILQARGQR